MEISVRAYNLNDIGAKTLGPYHEGYIDYSCADMLTLVKVLKGALIITPEQREQCLEERRVIAAERKAREQAFADAHNWDEIIARKYKKADTGSTSRVYAEIRSRILTGRKIDPNGLAAEYGVTYGTIQKYKRKIENSIQV